jgi:hypothetical protein
MRIAILQKILKHGHISLSWKEVIMKSLKCFGVFIFLTGILSVPGFALEGETSPGQPQIQNEIHTTSPSSPSSIYMNVEGKLKEIQGDMYILEGNKTDTPIRVQVKKDTAFPNGHKEPGQSVEALVSAQDGHALIIR